MKRTPTYACPIGLLACLLCVASPTWGQELVVPGPVTPAPAAPGHSPENTMQQKFKAFERLTQGAKTYEGLFKLYQKEDHVYAEIRPHQFDRPLLCPIAIARGAAMGGYTLNFDSQWVLVFKHVGDKVQVVRRNVRFQASKAAPLAKAVETTYTDSILLALRIQGINQQHQSVLIDLNDIFMTDFAQLRFGSFDANRSSWHKVKAFPQNIELEVAATYGSYGSFGRYFFFGDDSVIDSRGKTVVIHYGLVQLPEFGYQPRLADDRVGYFLSVVKDFSSDNHDTSFLRHVNRWRLERAERPDPKHPNKLSPPKKKIVFWIEKSVPDEYRAYVREGILEWNKAFERIGFRDAIEVRQQENEDFDPEDINYNTFRWITTDMAFAMGPSRSNPLTGEILDADILFDSSMVRYWKQEQRVFRSSALGEIADPPSLIQATRLGWGLGNSPLMRMQPPGWDERKDLPGPEVDLRARMWAVQQGVCQCASCMKYELGLAAMTMAARGTIKPGAGVPDELIGQAIKEVTMHEVGHTLGLRHNFKASTMLKNEQLHDTAITRKDGLVGSVMDYSPVNLAPKGVKQGDYFTTTIGPYDYWAIEYAYKPLPGGTEGEYEKLQEIANRGALPGHDYGTDEDMYGTADPSINVWDLGADPMKFAQDRMLLAEELLKGLAERVVDKGEGYQRVREAFATLLGQYGNGAYLISNFVGGEYIHRDHRGDPQARDPFVPVAAAKQREALLFLQEHLLSDKAFQFSPELLRKLAADRWMHWGNEYAVFGGVEFPINDRVMAIQRIVLDHMLSPNVLARIQNNALKADKAEQPLQIAEVFRTLTDGIWTELPKSEPSTAKASAAKNSLKISVIRRNLQREYVKELANLVLGPRQRMYNYDMFFFGFGFSSRSAPPDARSLARMHMRELDKRLSAALNGSWNQLDDTTRAHLEECQERIAKVFTAAMQVNEP
jgi:hypothetical protein